MRIIHVPRRFVTDEWGGSETFIAETSYRLEKKGYQMEIFTSKALDTTGFELYRGIPIRRFSYSYPYIGLSKKSRAMLDKKAGNLFSFSLMHALQKTKDVDVIHLDTGKRLGGIVRYCALKKHIPYVISLHGGNLAVPKEEQETWTEPTKGTLEWGKLLGLWVGSRRVLNDAAAIICVGKDEYEAMSKKFPDKQVEYLPNGVDIDRFAYGNGPSFRSLHGIGKDRFVFLTVARLDVQKNQLGLVRQLPSMVKKIPNAHLVFLGHITSKEYVATLTSEAKALGVEDRITLIGGIPYSSTELVDAYHSADCFVLPSLHEPFGMVVLEAWASEKPVAVSQRGGLTSLVSEGKDGMFFDPEAPEDNASSISSVLGNLAANPELRKKLGEEGLKTAKESYSWDSITSRLETIYRSINENSVS
ncbi:glycosyltransferase [Sphaerochaeta pleomorpha str. Grapes]|uniref:Glycosyltransferase n=2 Tax=Sphaerochaeta TaxID=399320 RepID=G8QSA8_SPHPG|nr:glycosyltransferase [Sphaerochaeta pleomorpha str. Grapes]